MPLPLLPTTELDMARMDRWSLLSRLQTLAYQVIPQWSDFSPNFPENFLLEAMALLAGMQASVSNERCRQVFKATVTDRLAMIRIGQPLGYTLTGATAAEVDAIPSLPNGTLAAKVITIPIGTRFAVSDVQYQAKTASSIAIGTNAGAAMTLENAESQTDSFQSDETTNIVVQLGMDNVIEDSITVADSFGTYSNLLPGSSTKLKSFLEVGPSDLSFISMLSSTGRAYVYFGNSINGRIPTGTINIVYKTGGGEAGRVLATANWTVLDTIYDSDGSPKTIQVANAAASVGGLDATTVDEARIRAPLALRTLERCVNEDDYEYVAGLTSGIARAAAVSSDKDTNVPEDEVYIYAIAYGTPYAISGYYPPAAPTTAQLTSIAANVAPGGSHPHMMGVAVSVRAALFLDVVISVKIYKESGYTAVQARANIEDSLQKFFAVATDQRAVNTAVDFGYKLLDTDGNPDYKIAWSRVLNVINDTAGIREVSYDTQNLILNGTHQSIVLDPCEFPRLSTINIYDMDQSGIAI